MVCNKHKSRKGKQNKHFCTFPFCYTKQHRKRVQRGQPPRTITAVRELFQAAHCSQAATVSATDTGKPSASGTIACRDASTVAGSGAVISSFARKYRRSESLKERWCVLDAVLVNPATPPKTRMNLLGSYEVMACIAEATFSLDDRPKPVDSAYFQHRENKASVRTTFTLPDSLKTA